MKWYWLALISVTCCASERPAHYPPPIPHPAVVAAHKAAEQAKEKRPSIMTLIKKKSIKK